ncbi:MAG: TetR/AcrR family transcriptional regulator [Trebonia sp.]
MGHREDLLAGAVACLREKGYARTTARDIVAASGANLGSIGYHYGSTENLLNAAVLAAVDEWGAQLATAMSAGIDPAAPFQRRFEQYWNTVFATFEDYREIWAATFDLFTAAGRVPEIRAAIADGLQDGRVAWASLLHGIDPEAEPAKAQAVGSVHQALLSGILVQLLVDPGRAPSVGDLAIGLRAIAGAVSGG